MLGPQLTWIYEHQSPAFAFGLAGVAALVQSVVVLILDLTNKPPALSRNASIERKVRKPSYATSVQSTTARGRHDASPNKSILIKIHYFNYCTSLSLVNQALPKEVFIEEIQQVLVRVLEERHFAIELHSAQCLVREILDRAFPFLRPGGREDRNHMEGANCHS